MRPPAKVHYLPSNHKVWTPPCVMYLHIMTRAIPGAVPEVLELAGWIARRVDRVPPKAGEPDVVTGRGATAEQLAQWINERVIGRTTVWLFAHNFGLDLASSRLPLVLAHAGWQCTEASVSGAAPWIRMVRGSKHLTIVGSWSYLPHTLDDLAEATKLPRPIPKGRVDITAANGDAADRSIDIITEAMGQLMAWWDRHELGRWSVSGPSVGWNAMRHIKPVQRAVIDPAPVGVAADRRAIHGGRRGAWVIGTRSHGPFLELDFLNAYPSVAASLPLPMQRTKAFTSMALNNWRLDSPRWGIIARCLIDTTESRYPVRFQGGTFCPTGRFYAELAGPEIRDALQRGHLLEIGAGYTHQLGYHLQNWARWVLALTHARDEGTPGVANLAAKAWSRSVIGKFAARGYERQDMGCAMSDGWSYTEGWDNATQTRGAMVSLAGQQWWSGVSGDSEQAYPAVLAWIESETRVRLSRVIDCVGEGAILQCDTDGLIVNEQLLGTTSARGTIIAPDGLRGAARTRYVLDQIAPLVAPLTLRVKTSHDSIRILGPQHVHTPGDRSFSGLPRMAKATAKDTYTFKTWPKLSFQMGQGDDRGYVRPEATVRIRGPYAPGWVTTSGRVIPPEAQIGKDGNNRLLSWHYTTNKPTGARLSDAQHPALMELW